MIKSLFLSLAIASFASAAGAQSVTALLNAFNLLEHPPTSVLTVVASGGDQTSCTAGKVPGSVIFLTLQCTSGTTVLGGTTLQASGTNVQSSVLNYGDVMCIFQINPTAAALAAAGAFPALPAQSVGWSCSTNTRVGSVATGSVSGQTAVVTGSVSWP